MAEVTGFTADRMRIIENTTVVDGEVQGDNLILQTREGVPIDAGNVRGPQGIQGVAGPVQSVNEQLGAVYSPRVFVDKAALDLWTAPAGSHGYTTTEQSMWVRVNNVWASVPGPRIFPVGAQLNTLWPNAPAGALAIGADDNQLWKKRPTGWFMDAQFRAFATNAAMEAWLAPEGSMATSSEGGGIQYHRLDGMWKKTSINCIGRGALSAPGVGGNCSMTVWSSSVNIDVQDSWGVRPIQSGCYAFTVNAVHAGGTSGGGQTFSLSIDRYTWANTSVPAESYAFFSGKGQFWAGLSFTQLFYMNAGDWWRINFGGDTLGSIDSRSFWCAHFFNRV